MADLLRFKDILEMDGIEHPLDSPRKTLSFNDLHVAEYRPGEDELTNYRAYKRRRVGDVGSDTATYSESFDAVGDISNRASKARRAIKGGMAKHIAMRKYMVSTMDMVKHAATEDSDVEEALNMQQRLKRSRLFKRLQPRIKMAREKAKRRIASKGKIELRSKKKARDLILRKLTKNVAKADLTFARRQELEKRLEKPAMKQKIAMLAKRLFPKIRKAEVDKKRSSK
jgi:hypothetical protein